MKTFEAFLLRSLLAVVVILFFRHFAFEELLKYFEGIYIALARTIDPGYTLTLLGQNALIWIAGITALLFVYER
jgi:hypothetical protein